MYLNEGESQYDFIKSHLDEFISYVGKDFNSASKEAFIQEMKLRYFENSNCLSKKDEVFHLFV